MENTVTEKIESFLQNYPHRHFSKGEYLITPEKDPAGIFVLQKGMVRVTSTSKNGIEVTLNIFKPTSFFPMQWVLNDSPNSYIYEALTDTDIVLVPKKEFKEYIEMNYDIAFDLLKRIYRGLDGYMKRMESLLSGDAFVRVVTTLLIHALRLREHDVNSVTLHLTHAQIASESGLTRETVTREMKKMQKEKLIEYKKTNFFIPDISLLEKKLAS